MHGPVSSSSSGQATGTGRVYAGLIEATGAHRERHTQVDKGDFEAAAPLLFKQAHVVGHDVIVAVARLACSAFSLRLFLGGMRGGDGDGGLLMMYE